MRPLEAWEIDVIRRREQEQRQEQPQLEIPVPPPDWRPIPPEENEENRGVIVIQIA